MSQINQEHYPMIEFDNTEQDIIQIWQKTEVIQLERENVENLIRILNNFKKPPLPIDTDEDLETNN